MSAGRSGAVRMIPETVKLKDGREALVRDAQLGDGQLVYDYLRVLGASTPYILTFPGDIGSAEHYESRVSKIDDGMFYSMSAIDPETGRIVGNTSFSFAQRVKLAHSAGLGTGVLPDWQSLGLGSWMLDRAISDMRANHKIHRLELTVMDGNEHALRMYERAGFTIEGRKLKSIRQPDGSYADEILMAMWIGE
jgi:RimJ/RimL family protein N-acetyltransferase